MTMKPTADQALRLDCLRLAVSLAIPVTQKHGPKAVDAVMPLAKKMYAFVTGTDGDGHEDEFDGD